MDQQLRTGRGKILVYRIGQLGDTVCAIPAIKAIREWSGPCDLVLLCDYHPGTPYPVAAEILSQFGLIDDWIIYSPKSSLALDRALALRREIRQRRISSMFYLAPARRTIVQRLRDLLFFRWCGIRDMHGLRLQASLSPPNGTRQEVDRLLEVVRSSGLPVCSQPSFNLPIPRAIRAQADELWRSLRLEGEIVLAVCPGSKMPAKRWGEDRYQELGLRLTSHDRVRLVILGGPEDQSVAEQLCRAWNGRGVNLAGKTSYAGSAEILRRCRLYVGNDNGAMHLAAAVGTPCVAIFSARDVPGTWYPYGEGHTVFRKDVECQGCMLVECAEQQMKCIRSISVDEVYRACAVYLNKKAQAIDASLPPCAKTSGAQL
ncbi:MAG: glycosyltransferase family 9 protein [candidate division NC10 bacterium]|nr:glycosyltransferase family 9 protein [candidate division NC10 bacterium]